MSKIQLNEGDLLWRGPVLIKGERRNVEVNVSAGLHLINGKQIGIDQVSDAFKGILAPAIMAAMLTGQMIECDPVVVIDHIADGLSS